MRKKLNSERIHCQPACRAAHVSMQERTMLLLLWEMKEEVLTMQHTARSMNTALRQLLQERKTHTHKGKHTVPLKTCRREFITAHTSSPQTGNRRGVHQVWTGPASKTSRAVHAMGSARQQKGLNHCHTFSEAQCCVRGRVTNFENDNPGKRHTNKKPQKYST